MVLRIIVGNSLGYIIWYDMVWYGGILDMPWMMQHVGTWEVLHDIRLTNMYAMIKTLLIFHKREWSFPHELRFYFCIYIYIYICMIIYVYLCVHIYIPIIRIPSMVEGSLEVKLPTIWTDGKAEAGRVREEKSRREKIREEKEWEERKCRCAKR